MRVIIPPMGNETISMLKNTSLLSVIAVLELYTVATQISSQSLRQVELLVVVSCWYLFLTTVLSVSAVLPGTALRAVENVRPAETLTTKSPLSGTGTTSHTHPKHGKPHAESIKGLST